LLETPAILLLKDKPPGKNSPEALLLIITGTPKEVQTIAEGRT
jgi:hypothetical protein